jgi:hypothetical protein
MIKRGEGCGRNGHRIRHELDSMMLKLQEPNAEAHPPEPITKLENTKQLAGAGRVERTVRPGISRFMLMAYFLKIGLTGPP